MSRADDIPRRPTPLLRWGPALLKLEMFRPSGSCAGRAAEVWDWSGAGAPVIEASGNEAIAAAAWARYQGVRIAIVPRGVFTHEMRETLKLWGVPVGPQQRATLPGLDSDAAVPLFARSLGAELLEDLKTAPPLLVAPAGDRAALLGALSVLRERWPEVRGVALVAADEELPDLPREALLPQEVERVAVTRAQAAQARSGVARELGLLAGHAAAAAAVYAHEHGGVALVTSPGEREFSLDRPP
ncbi:MAG: hypothetical protein ABR567_09025 [Myxococcales bacterium]|nr:PLP-dependent lyase/thiolase [Myxococcales bacterium]